MLRFERLVTGSLGPIAHLSQNAALKRMLSLRQFSSVANASQSTTVGEVVSDDSTKPSTSSTQHQRTSARQQSAIPTNVVERPRGLCEEQKEIKVAINKLVKAILDADAAIREATPKFMRPHFMMVYALMANNVQYDDLIFGYKTKDIYELRGHVVKVRFYLSFKSPYNSFEWLGSAIHSDRNALTVLWRLTTQAGVSFFTKYSLMRVFKPTNYGSRVLEGALDCYFNEQGLIVQIVNRKVTEEDMESVRQTDEVRKEVVEKVIKEEEEEKPKPVGKFDMYR